MLPALVFGMWRKFSPIGKLLYHRSARCARSDIHRISRNTQIPQNNYALLCNQLSIKICTEISCLLPPRSNNKLHYSLHIFLTHIRPHLPRTWIIVLLAKNNTRALFFLHNSPVIFGIITDRKKEEKCQGGPPTALGIMISSPQVLSDSSRTCPSQRSASVGSIRPYFWNRCPLLTTRRKSHPGLSPVFICIELNRGQARRKRVAAFLQKG
ncbi:hypothetical protein CDAR_613841 [Caerostris darwini]|uniref:Uncharacterized protein n=1 Tax=Caerostris darwini TaxID=1538125 RepID=A0AAV4MHD8_9ARAC|nr:hypothetical protein CDAR_613841 [Caerostris darwini]